MAMELGIQPGVAAVQRMVEVDVAHGADQKLRDVLRTPDWQQQDETLRLMLQPRRGPIGNPLTNRKV